MSEIVKLIDYMGNDLSIVNAARVSFGKRHDAFDVVADTKLINYLANNDHWTPFAQTAVTLWFKMPIFVARQWARHTVGLVINEVSRRYVDSPPEFNLPEQLRGRAEKVKQGSGEDLPDSMNLVLLANIELAYEGLFDLYEKLLANGVCPEQARMVLPLSTYTEFTQTGNVASYARICKQRLGPHAQKEIQEYARAVSDIMAELFPVSWEALISKVK